MVQHALVLEPSGHVELDPIMLAKSVQSVDSAVQSDPSQESGKPEFSCLAHRDSGIKEQGFCEAVAAQIEALQGLNQISLSGKVDHFYKVVPQ